MVIIPKRPILIPFSFI